MSLATVGLFTTTLFAAHLLVQVPGGRAVDALGARRVGLAALVWLAACNALLLLAPDPALALGVRALAGVGTGAAFVAAGDYARGAGTPLALGLFGGASIGGSGLAVAVVPLLDGRLGWRTSEWTALVLAVAALPLLAAGPSDRVRFRHDAPASLLRDARLYRLGAMHAATFGFSLIAGNWVVTLLERTSGYSDERAGLAGSLTLVGSLLTRPLGGVLIRSRPGTGRAVTAACAVVGAAGTAALAAFAPVPLAVAVVASLAVGLAAGLPFAAIFGAAQRLRADAPAAATGLSNGIAIVAIVVGTPLAGLAFSLPGDGRVAFAALAVLGLAALIFLPRRGEL